MRGHDRGRRGCADIGGRCDRDAMHVDAEDPRARQAKEPVDENPDESAEYERRRLGETGDRGPGTHARDEYVDQRRAQRRRVRQP